MINLAKALSAAQGMIRNAVKDSSNPHFGNKYADLASIWDAIREPLTKNGLSILQTTHTNEANGLYLKTTLLHVSGEFVESEFPLRPHQNTSQALGSCLTYARRYSLSAICGVAQADETNDDGNAASGPAPSNSRSPAPRSAPPKAPVLEPESGGWQWARKAAAAFLTSNEAALERWEKANFDKVERLKGVEPAAAEHLMQALSARWDTLRQGKSG